MSLRVSENGVQRVSTRDERASKRFEFWRSLHERIELDVCDREASKKDFNAELLRYQAASGADFGYGINDDTVAYFAKPNGRFVLMSLPLSGAVCIRANDGRATLVRAGQGMVVVDGAKSLTSTSRDHSQLCMTLPHHMVSAVMGDDLEGLGDGLRVLPNVGLVAFLVSHLKMMATSVESLPSASAEVAMATASDLALGVLAQMRDKEAIASGNLNDGAVYAAACRFIELQFGRSDLTSSVIARAVGCSRAHLYRAFSSREQNIGDVVRMTRMEHASALLAFELRLTIEQIAHRCGYSNGAAFARAFRAYVGVSASEFRASRCLQGKNLQL